MSSESINLDEFFVPDDVEVVEPEDDLESIGDFDNLFQEVNEFENSNKPEPKPLPIEPYNPDDEPCVEDFIRQFLASKKMNGTIEIFERELYELQQRGEYDPRAKAELPSVYRENIHLQEQLTDMNSKLQHMVTAANRAKLHFDRFQKQRDFHRMHHRRVVQEKQKLIADLRRLKVHYEQFEPALHQLRTKYEGAMKEQLLAKLERERLTAKLSALQKQLAEQAGGPNGSIFQNDGDNSVAITGREGTTRNQDSIASFKRGSLLSAGGSSSKGLISAGGSIMKNNNSKSTGGNNQNTSVLTSHQNSSTTSSKNGTPWPVSSIANPYASASSNIPQTNGSSLKVTKSFSVHQAPISKIAIHPKLPIVATASDDCTWSTWALPNGDLLMSGEGHKDFVSALDFHPFGSILATGGGDGVVRLWDLLESKWHTIHEHSSSTIWDLAFHHSGDFFVSASQDGTARVIDSQTLKTRQALRGHVDSVNSVCFQPYSNTILTASADKTASLWDMRSGLCVQTFYGHENAVNNARFALQGNQFASCDADGVVKLFDVRNVKQLMHIDTSGSSSSAGGGGQSGASAAGHATNAVAFDRSGKTLAVASGDATIKIIDLNKNVFVTALEGHSDSVNDVCFDPHGTVSGAGSSSYNNGASRFLVSAGSDGSFKIWQ